MKEKLREEAEKKGLESKQTMLAMDVVVQSEKPQVHSCAESVGYVSTRRVQVTSPPILDLGVSTCRRPREIPPLGMQR